jgi:hypothetical protein
MGVASVALGPDIVKSRLSRSTYEMVDFPQHPELQVRDLHWDLLGSYCRKDPDAIMDYISDKGIFSKASGGFTPKNLLLAKLEQKLDSEQSTCTDVGAIADYEQISVYTRVQAERGLINSDSTLLDEIEEGGFGMLENDLIAIIPLRNHTNHFMVAVYRLEDDGKYRAVLLR